MAGDREWFASLDNEVMADDRELVQAIIDAACAWYDSGDYDMLAISDAVRAFRER